MVPLASPVCLARRTPFPNWPALAQAGGRPNTIDINNWKQYLKADGTPSARLIVEGANLFITQQAQPQACCSVPLVALLAVHYCSSLPSLTLRVDDRCASSGTRGDVQGSGNYYREGFFRQQVRRHLQVCRGRQ